MKAVFFWVAFVVTVAYGVKSVCSFGKNYQRYQLLHQQYLDLSKQKEQISLSLNVLQRQVKGLREDSLDLAVLKERLKSMLNYKDSSEYIVTN